MRIATQDDWENLQPLGPDAVHIPLSLTFSAPQMHNLRRGFIPIDQSQKWFLWFEHDRLHIHRSWTGIEMFEVCFKAAGKEAVAHAARVCRDPELFSGTLEEAREILLDVLRYYASDKAHEPHESAFVRALREAAQPNYLGSPEVMSELLRPFVWGALCKELRVRVGGVERIPGYEKIDPSDLCALNVRITAVLCGQDASYHGLEPWRTESGLGQAVIHQFGLDVNWYADENLACIVSEGLAAVALQIGQIVAEWAKEEPLDLDALLAMAGALLSFISSVLLGTHKVLFPDAVLEDFTWKNRARFAPSWADYGREDPAPQPGPNVHPRPDDDGKPVRLVRPSTPTLLSAWHDPTRIAVVIPDGPMPAELAGIPFASCQDAPREPAGWEARASRSCFDEPPFQPQPGKKAAAGVVIREADGRVWVVAPSNAYGGYPATFPKGTCEPGMSLRAAALREAFEEAGLEVTLESLLMDVNRTVSSTRYYLARRTGGNPADMGWESQAVMLVPVEAMATVLTNKNDAAIIKAIKSLAQR